MAQENSGVTQSFFFSFNRRCLPRFRNAKGKQVRCRWRGGKRQVRDTLSLWPATADVETCRDQCAPEWDQAQDIHWRHVRGARVQACCFNALVAWCMRYPPGAGGQIVHGYYFCGKGAKKLYYAWRSPMNWSRERSSPWPYLCDNPSIVRWAAKDKRALQSHSITHVLNAADGKFNVCTGASFYQDIGIAYFGVEAFDMPSFDISPFFYSAARFIKDALSNPTGEKAGLFIHKLFHSPPRCLHPLFTSILYLLLILCLWGGQYQTNHTMGRSNCCLCDHRNLTDMNLICSVCLHTTQNNILCRWEVSIMFMNDYVFSVEQL